MTKANCATAFLLRFASLAFFAESSLKLYVSLSIDRLEDNSFISVATIASIVCAWITFYLVFII
jgi:hypothetical protein